MAVSKQTPGSQEERDSDAVITKDRRNWALPKTNKQKKKKKKPPENKIENRYVVSYSLLLVLRNTFRNPSDIPDFLYITS